MAWMKVDHWLPNKPELVKIQRSTGLGQPGVIGSLVLVWIWFSEHSVDGALAAEPEDLDIVAQHRGFAEAMIRAGWLVQDGDKLSMPGFDKWLGSALEARQRAAQRAAKGGVGNLSATVADNNTTTTSVSPTVGSQTQTQTQTQTDNLNQSPSPTPSIRGPEPRNGQSRVEPWRGVIPEALSGHGFPQAWDRWIRYKHERLEAVTQVSGDALLERCGAFGAKASVAAITKAVANGWKGPVLEDESTGPGDGLPVSRAIRDRTGLLVCAMCGWDGCADGKCSGCGRAWKPAPV